MIDGGVGFWTTGTEFATPVTHNKVRSTAFMTATSSSVTFSTQCAMIRSSGDEDPDGAVNDLAIELIPFN